MPPDDRAFVKALSESSGKPLAFPPPPARSHSIRYSIQTKEIDNAVVTPLRKKTWPHREDQANINYGSRCWSGTTSGSDGVMGSVHILACPFISPLACHLCGIQRTKLYRYELPANDVMRRFSVTRPFILFPRVAILRNCDTFVTNFTAILLKSGQYYNLFGGV
ncbi:hypothetical protein EVAR_18900_1 [Eumeta japonica]|uniref:Uncharacterized protein n=1 Tax=Eumeta variegata TaxID=151549 RepID=A0A4C1V1R4_EUMVA|nr:hypothetical protein EVAR_18900_1 [Eumeta japonica]